ncbi:RHS repeat-associated core domain-containing protein, partial [Xaviernesmea oryzae]
TLYPSADIEIDANTPGSEVFTYYPHPDIKITATAGGITGRYVLLRDHLASIRRVTDANGNVAEETSYAAYGELTNTSMQTQKSYIGERFDPQTGLTYLNARSYDPAFGRYVPPDEAGDQAGQARPKQVGHP